MDFEIKLRRDGPIKDFDDIITALKGHEGDNVTVLIESGIYRLTKPAVFSAETVGRRTGKLKIIAEGGEVRLLGGQIITGFSPVTDTSIRARLRPEVRDRVLQFDPEAAGIKDPGKLSSTGFSRNDQVSPLELFCDGEPMTIAQYPDKDEWLHIAGSPTGNLEDGFYYDSDRPDGWQDDPDIWVHGYWGWDWANTCEKIDVFDKKNRFIKNHPDYGIYNYTTGQRFYFFNVLEELDKPGEYYVDRMNGRVYLYPPEGFGEILASQLESSILAFDGITGIEISGLTIEGGRSHAISFKDCEGVRITRCVLRNCGEWGIHIIGGRDYSIIGNDIYNTGEGGIYSNAGDRFKLVSGETVIGSNDIHHFSRIARCYRAGVNFWGVGCLIRNNLIHDAPHTAIFYFANDVKIENNEIYSVCMETGDCGAIYSGRDFSVLGIEICNNYIHHMGGIGVGSSGVYSDDCLSFTDIHHNLFYHTTNSVNSNGGYKINVHENVFAESHPALLMSATGVHPHENIRNMMDEYMHNLLFEKNPASPPYSDRYPELAEILELYDKSKHPTMMLPGLIYFRDNIMHSSDFVKKHWTVKPEMLIEEDTVHAKRDDFADIDFSDITPKSDMIDTTKIGPVYAERAAEPARVFTSLTRNAQGLLLKTVNKGHDTVQFDIVIYDMKNRKLSQNISFRLGPGMSEAETLHLEADPSVTIEARSSFSGVRPARLTAANA